MHSTSRSNVNTLRLTLRAQPRSVHICVQSVFHLWLKLPFAPVAR